MMEDFFSCDNMEGCEDVGSEWLSIFVEDCLSGSTIHTTSISQHLPTTTTLPTSPTLLHTPPPKPLKSQTPKPPTTQKPALIPAKPRTKRTKPNPKALLGELHDTLYMTSSDPPLLHQAHWLADSELIIPKKEAKDITAGEEGEERDDEKVSKDVESVELVAQQQQARRCSHCLSHRTPQWRQGPKGPKTLCNACGVRFKSGRLLPEYRPAKSPTFVSYKHSNSHKKVLEMRMAITSSNHPH